MWARAIIQLRYVKAGLRRAVVRLSAHVGYYTVKLSDGRPTACCIEVEGACGLSYS